MTSRAASSRLRHATARTVRARCHLWKNVARGESPGTVHLTIRAIATFTSSLRPVTTIVLLIGASPARMAEFETELLDSLGKQTWRVFAWVVLPNHYHLLIEAADLALTLSALGRLHGRSSFDWNTQDQARGRKVW